LNYGTFARKQRKITIFFTAAKYSWKKLSRLPFCYLYTSNLSTLLRRQVQINLPTRWGPFTMYAYAESHEEAQPHIALVHQNTYFSAPVLLRIHSECLTGDLLGSLRCDCGAQFTSAMDKISAEGGVLIYLRQEGRGIGLINKMEAYQLQDTGMDTVQANIHLGFQPDERDFGLAIEILHDLQISSVRLLTNNPDKIDAFSQSSISLAERVPLIIPSVADNQSYLRTKQEVMGHLL